MPVAQDGESCGKFVSVDVGVSLTDVAEPGRLGGTGPGRGAAKNDGTTFRSPSVTEGSN